MSISTGIIKDGSKYVPVKALIPTASCGTPSALLPASNFQTLGGANLDSRIREDIVDRGIEKGEWEMRNLSKQLGYESSDQEPHVGRVGEHNSGQMAADASDQTGTTPFNVAQGEDLPERAGISRKEQDAHERQVDPEAVRESEKEAELDPIAENEPEEGEKAA
jgi:hypothetical protein